MNYPKQMSESIVLGAVLAVAGGFMDAYSYLCRGGVFANAQTGNMLLLGIKLSEKDWDQAVQYLFPVLAFALGIALADTIRFRSKEEQILHWRQISVFVEAVILLLVGFFPQELNMAANSLASFACGIQVESFRKIHGNGIATTMCIGNLRSATQNMCDYMHTGDKKSQKKSWLYYSVIFFFATGAIIGDRFVNIWGEYAIFACSGMLFIAFAMMFADWEKDTVKTEWFILTNLFFFLYNVRKS